MAKRPDRKSGRFRIYTSDRSGFEYGFQPITSYPNAYTRESGKPTRDENILVAPSEFDSPPPSKKSLGGEGDISSSDIRSNSDPSVSSNVYVIPQESSKVIYYINSSNTIPQNSNPVVYISGSNANQIMAVNPQISSGTDYQVIALQCVGSSVTLKNGSGLTFEFSGSTIKMDSGGIATMIYLTSDNLWHVSSFNPNGGF